MYLTLPLAVEACREEASLAHLEASLLSKRRESCVYREEISSHHQVLLYMVAGMQKIWSRKHNTQRPKVPSVSEYSRVPPRRPSACEGCAG